MKLLLDTNAFLYFALGSPRLSGRGRQLIEENAGESFVSAVTPWELAVKFAIGKLTLPAGPDAFYRTTLLEIGATELPIESGHCLRAARLPFHHHDPFDRMLVAQASLLDIPILTNDRWIRNYDVVVTW